MRYAVIDNGVVVNVVIWDGETEWPLPPDLSAIDCAPQVGIGWTWNNDDGFIAPPEPDETPV